MKKILFKKLRLFNFCGIRDLEISFGKNITTISGSNGVGKSTIGSALTYVLFGTDLKGNALDIKTFDENHKIIPEISHEAELVVLVDDEEMILKRSLTDSWKGEQVKNTYKYFVNGDVCTAGDYKKVVDGICPEITFRLCSSATDFVSRPWKDQRKFLQLLVPEITADAITNGDRKYDFVLEALQKQDIETIVRHLKYSRNEIQKQLDEVPIRLKELNKAIPESEDWEILQESCNNKEIEKENTIAQIASLKTGGAAQLRNESIRKQLEFQHKRMDEMERSARNLAYDESTKHESDLITARTALSRAKSMVEELQAKMDGFTDTEIHIKQQLEELDNKNKQGAKCYDEVLTERWQWDDKESFCPHCLQPLPLNKLYQIKQESEANFNKRKAERLKEFAQTAGDIKNERIKCQGILEQLGEERKMTIGQLTEAHKALNESEMNLSEIEKVELRSYSAILEENTSYKQAYNEVARLEDELNKPIDDKEEQQEMLVSLEKQVKIVSEEIGSLRSRLAKKETFDRITTLIEECKKNKETYQNQIDELDDKLDVANDYYQQSCSLLEEEVNKHFSFVKFTLFQTNLDGDKKPYCECYHNGVPYNRLNGAAKVNAGIDIAYTIARFYEVSVPMILDECESNLYPIYNGGQQIRLSVSPSEKILFTYEDGNQD